jgi:hypothetical protein
VQIFGRKEMCVGFAPAVLAAPIRPPRKSPESTKGGARLPSFFTAARVLKRQPMTMSPVNLKGVIDFSLTTRAH